VGEIKERFVDKIAKGEPLVIRDEKTLSGRVHVGSLRGVVIHGLLAQVLQEQGIPSVFRFELNDFDPMDEAPEKYLQHMGEPLYRVPNYPMLWGRELQEAVAPLRLPIEWYTLRPHYERGEFNEVIREALDHAAEIRAIYREVSGSVKPDDWFPLQVVCEKCGKIGTTQVTHWDPAAVCHGERSRTMTGLVTYTCKPDLVKWAKGCGHTGTISPFNGNTKLPWKVEWPAKWKVFGVDIEGCGKDHSAAGGSRDIGRRIVTEVFHYPEPFNIPYEFFNLGGKKMSASKGIGASAKEISDMLPPELLKLLMIRKLPNHPIDFDPNGDTLPLLFDEFDRLADHEFKRHPKPDPDFARTFRLTQIHFPKKPPNLWHMRFSVLSFVLQMPHLSLEEEAEKLKGLALPARRSPGDEVGSQSKGSALTEDENTALQTRATYVKKWLDEHAPEEYRFTILEQPPVLSLDGTQRLALQKLMETLKHTPWDGAQIHEAIHAVKAETGIEPKKLFQPLYQAFLGRDNGPQMGWFLSTFTKNDVVDRLKKIR
ncbi:lysine--tRNA ligase, partial [Candidatus Peregrinibacteria bacterium]|nr:lysine--tRNA ligase [Candidatus Peregrinibacteria bacterium]